MIAPPHWSVRLGVSMRVGAENDEEEMSTRPGDPERLSVGALSFDPESGELSGPAGIERIAPKPASLLVLLASRAGEVVSRDEIRDHLWPGGKVEFEQGIAFAVREVRKAIESAGGDPAVLETIPKRGLRIAQPRAHSVPTAPRRRADSWRVVLPPLVAIGVLAAVGLGIASMRRPATRLPAVVVFTHDAEDEPHAELARAVGYELTTALTQTFEGRLGIIGPTGTASLSGPDDTDGARAALGACLVVSGGIRAVGRDSIVVFTQIVRTLDRVHAWATQDTVPASSAASVVPRIVDGVASARGSC
jgi:DNA-binding winged helix-turn-helix (wHTH) protein